MPFRMQPAQFPHGGWPESDDRTPGSDQTYPRGTPVTWDTASQELDEHALSTTVTGILGVSLEGVTAGVAHNPSGKVGVALASRSNVFMAKLVNASGVIQTAATSNINVNYGLLDISSGLDEWTAVDEDDVTHVVVEVIGIDTDRNIVFFKFIESAIQQP